MTEPPDISEALAPHLPSRRLQRWLLFIGVILLTAALGTAEYLRITSVAERELAAKARMRAQPGLPPTGGRYFGKRVQIEVPSFRQSDPRWASDPLGPSPTDTLSSAGCAVASCAMILASYGVDTDPQRLNAFLNRNNGFTPEAWLKWEVAAGISPDKVRFVYEDVPSYQLIDENLERGNPVIIRIRYTSGMTHFVVICGKNGYDYLITDPGRHGGRGVILLEELGCNIEALRFYEKVKQPAPVTDATPP